MADNYENYQGYSNSFQGYSGSSYRRINILEIGTVLVSVVLIVGIFIWGLNSQNQINRDRQRNHDINEVITALEDFYINTSTIPSRRFYPISVCSGSLNEVDFELTLRQHLTGALPEIDTHTYIQPDRFPRDKWGDYATTFGDRRVDFRCPEKLTFNEQVTTNTQIYSDGYPTCNFSSRRGVNRCYLYTSSTSGDTFKIGYFQESSNQFIIYTKFREEPLRLEISS